jgi:predicted DNA-binding transcriptional regulator AlpA
LPLQDHLAYPPRAMRAERAAAYLGMSTSKFFQLVEDGRMPRPVRIDGMVTWDRLELDAAYESLKDQSDPESTRRNTLDVLLEDRDDHR